MGRVIDFNTRLPVENCSLTIPLNEARGVVEHKKVFHVVHKRQIFEVKKKNLDTILIGELQEEGSSSIKKPVVTAGNKYYSVIMDLNNIYVINVESREIELVCCLVEDTD